jgi:tellurite resistance protein TerC
MVMIYAGFVALVLALLALDLGVFHRRSHAIRVGEALGWTAFWVSLGLSFTIVIYFLFQHHRWGFGTNFEPFWPHNGRDAAKMYVAGYLLEFSLSVDNIFVIALIISYFRVPGLYQHRVLFWGILGALIMRGTMIALGTELVQRFEWAIYVFGVLLIVTAIRMLSMGDQEIEPDRNPLVRFARRFYPVTPDFVGSQFFTRWNGKRAVTPLFLVVLVVESTDLLFAVDSIPAIIGVTRDPFLVFTSNVFAIMGLRSLYFALAGMMSMFRYLKVSLVVLLLFIGVKMLTEDLLYKWTGHHLSITVSLCVIAGILGLGISASLISSRIEQVLQAAALMKDPVNLTRLAWRQVRRLVILVVGSTVVLIGIIMIVTPGPAVVVVPLGLLILSTEFVWAKRLLEQVKRRIKSAAGYDTEPYAPNCKKCGYSLRGLTESRCPECGEPFSPEVTQN